jgi:hypothetical protein
MSFHKHISSGVGPCQASPRPQKHRWVGRRQRGLQSARVPVGGIVAHYWGVGGSQNARGHSIHLDRVLAETRTELVVTNWERNREWHWHPTC